jgi:uncharacterized protein YndB with AHSA1/START domain
MTVAVVERVMPAPPGIVFDEWLDPDALTDWMCPRPAHVTKAVVDGRVDGEYRFDVEDSGTTLHITGRYLVVDRPQRLQFTWFCSPWPADAVDSIVTVTFAPHGDDETLMTIHHELLAAEQVVPHRRGWTACGEQLSARLSRALS